MWFFHLSGKPLGKEIPFLSEVIRASRGNPFIPAELGSISFSSSEGSLMSLQTVFLFSAMTDELCFAREFCSFHSCATHACVPAWGKRAGVNQCKQQPCNTIDVILVCDNIGQFDVV